MTYRHGVYAGEVPTSVVPPRRVSASIPFVVGLAPTVKADGSNGPINQVKVCYTYGEAVAFFGVSKDFAKYTLNQFFYTAFQLYGIAPVLAVNVLDPTTHKTEVSAESKAFDSDDELQLAHSPVVGGSVVVKDATDTTTYVEDADYEVNYLTGIITRLADGDVDAGDTVHVSYDYVDPSLVEDDDIIGGVDGDGVKTGLELINDVFPRFGLVPGIIIAPGWSHDAGVAAIMAAKAESINNLFRALAIVDLPDSVTLYSDAPAAKTANNLASEFVVACWPNQLALDEDRFHHSCHTAALMAAVDADHDDIPFKSLSNEKVQMTAALAGSNEVWLDPEQATYLNGQGIHTVLNFNGAWKAWGNRTTIYPGSTDVKDTFIPIRRMFNWIANRAILTAWQWVDFPIRRRLIDTVVDSFNIWLNGLTAGEYILGGRIVFLESENPLTDVMDGMLTFHIYITPPSPAREIEFVLEYDPSYIQALTNTNLK